MAKYYVSIHALINYVFEEHRTPIDLPGFINEIQKVLCSYNHLH